jgi:acetate kinase
MAEGSNILVLNAGSSSIKFAAFDRTLSVVLRGALTGVDSRPRITATHPDGEMLVDRSWPASKRPGAHDLLAELMQWLEVHLGASPLAAVGHRVAIGGLEHTGPELVTAGLLEKLRRLEPLAPLHQPANLEPIEILARLHSDLPQVACFDTAFHRTLPRVAELYGLPKHLTDAGARRYGFHGLSYEYVSNRLADIDQRAARGRTVVAHLGSGASMCALRGGKSIATTMGFSPLSGLVMGTRPGELDPGVLIWLVREHGMSVDAIERMLYHDCGLKGVSGISADMRELLASDDPNAGDAVELFVYRVSTELGSLAASLGGIDALIFTGGIGEHAPAIRQAVCERSAWLGVRIDNLANTRAATRISADGSAVSVFVVPTNEELMIATHTASLTNASPGMPAAIGAA